MNEIQPTGIQLHLITGNKPMFYQEDSGLVALICADLDGRVFTRPSLIIESREDVTAFPGHALVGITVLTDPLPASFLEHERLTKAVVSEISPETFKIQRLRNLAKVEGTRGPMLCEIELTSGDRLFLELSEVAENGIDERSSMHHLFSRPSIACRRLEGGFSIWNTAHIVSWSHYPKLEVPAGSWPADPIAPPQPTIQKALSLK